jgi:hypothetical protein
MNYTGDLDALLDELRKKKYRVIRTETDTPHKRIYLERDLTIQWWPEPSGKIDFQPHKDPNALKLQRRMTAFCEGTGWQRFWDKYHEVFIWTVIVGFFINVIAGLLVNWLTK